MTAPIHSVFVYGTLQQGECRERCWPRPPRKIEPATVRGVLYDLGPYPALIDGDDLVAGELWHLAPEDVSITLAELDRVEAFTTAPDDLYRRVVVTCQTNTSTVQAWTYQYARTADLKPAQRILPSTAGLCRWKRSSDS
jgi:gamma-glutamylcyclotransferase (GGCT)/AIG2-like uncharacterized protein YtfP